MYKRLEQELDYVFQNGGLLRLALTHSSYSHEMQLTDGNNERLEFLGDAVLEMNISEALYLKYPEMSEGSLTKLRACVVCETSLASVARRLQLGRYVRLGKGEEQTGGCDKDSILSDALEAVLGAIYLDGGLQAARRVIEHLLGEKTTEDQLADSDQKTYLQEQIQKKSRIPLVYEIVDEAGPSHDKRYTARVLHEGVILGEGGGRSKKEAEQMAAKQAVEKLI